METLQGATPATTDLRSQEHLPAPLFSSVGNEALDSASSCPCREILDHCCRKLILEGHPELEWCSEPAPAPAELLQGSRALLQMPGPRRAASGCP